jgi:dTDP-L-rhamnose 4-epimerase
MKILITGGAGFIGTHLTRRLLANRHAIRILDSFTPQIHGDEHSLPADFAGHVDLVIGDVRDEDVFERAVAGCNVVVHLAAETGTGQSMYEILRYEEVNIRGTAILMDIVTNRRPRELRKIVVASSRAIYGEGKYRCEEHGPVYPGKRHATDMKNKRYEPLCPLCQNECIPLATDEDTPPRPSSFYGLTKYVQEQMALMQASALNLSAYALRYQNVYGPGQSLKNPYTGILAIFFNRARAGQSINIFEDGRESRDFVYVEDVVDATARCIDAEGVANEVLNVGTGTPVSVSAVAQEIVSLLGSNSRVDVTGAFRIGDIRHNFADLTRIKDRLSFTPRWDFRRGLRAFLDWALRQESGTIGYESSLEALRKAGLYHQS